MKFVNLLRRYWASAAFFVAWVICAIFVDKRATVIMAATLYMQQLLVMVVKPGDKKFWDYIWSVLVAMIFMNMTFTFSNNILPDNNDWIQVDPEALWFVIYRGVCIYILILSFTISLIVSKVKHIENEFWKTDWWDLLKILKYFLSFVICMVLNIIYFVIMSKPSAKDAPDEVLALLIVGPTISSLFYILRAPKRISMKAYYEVYSPTASNILGFIKSYINQHKK